MTELRTYPQFPDDRREVFVQEALSCLGTPFRDYACIKGPNGAMDCAMFLVHCARVAGLVPPDYDPGPYPPQHMLHQSDELFLGVVRRFAREAERAPLRGDIVIFHFARCFSHGAVVVDPNTVVHAWKPLGKVTLSSLGSSSLAFERNGTPRARKTFTLWAN